jgi:hypothetical protein
LADEIRRGAREPQRPRTREDILAEMEARREARKERAERRRAREHAERMAALRLAREDLAVRAAVSREIDALAR